MITEGILNINKPQNMTSHDVISAVRRKLGVRRVGHTGTLDPMATGVLPVCIGKSTRIMEYLDTDIKEYVCSMILGISTDTQDIWGKVLEEKQICGITSDDVLRSFDRFSGVIDQRPPMYSALKVHGKKLYEYARAGIEVEVKTRKVFIESLNVADSNPEFPVTFTVRCSKGTYIRTICQDTGNDLGCGAALCRLKRTQSGIFRVESAVELEKFKEMNADEIKGILYKTYEPLADFGEVDVSETAAAGFITGKCIETCGYKTMGEPKYADKDFQIELRDDLKRAYKVFGKIMGKREFLGVAFKDKDSGILVADKIFYAR